MPLIQDVLPPKRRPLKKRLIGVHKATNILHLAELSQQKIDVIRPSHGINARRAMGKPTATTRTRHVPQLPPAPTQSAKKSSQSFVKAAPKPVRYRRLRRMADFAQYPIIAALALASAYSSTAGQLFVAAYFAIALLFKIESRYAFGAALLLLVSIPAFQLLGQSGIAENNAIYTYELLVGGTLQAILETIQEGRRKRRQPV